MKEKKKEFVVQKDDHDDDNERCFLFYTLYVGFYTLRLARTRRAISDDGFLATM